jgi:hypothetical protein
MRRKYIYVMEGDQEGATAALRREDRAESLAKDCARDGGYAKGDYSISMGICICMGIGIASIVCISIKFKGMSINNHKSKH